MKIAYDGSMLRWQKAGGILRYFSEIISRLPTDWKPTVLGMEASAENHPQHPRITLSNRSSTRPRRVTQPLKTLYWKRQLLASADLVHPTYYGLSEGLTYSDIKCPMVVTVYDMIYATYPDQFADSESFVRHQHEAVRRAEHVICISRFTEEGVLRQFPEAAGKTSVIHLAASFPLCTAPVPETLFEVPTFLFVGGRGGYKNFPFLLKAFARACLSHPTMRLRVAGSPFTPAEKAELAALDVERRVDLSVYPKDDELQQLYRQSVALLYPSVHEGFGIPPLEAMASGTLAVAANTTCLPEIVGNGGILLDPTRADDWSECMLTIARRQGDRDSVIARGFKRLAAFSWAKTAHQHVAIYQKLAPQLSE